MSRKLKKRLIRIIISLVLFIALFIVDKVIDLSKVFPFTPWEWLFPLLLYSPIYLFISYDILIKAVKNIAHGQVFDENFLMIVATFGAFAIVEFPEAVAVMLFYQIGEFFQDLAVGKSRKEIASLMDIKSDTANLIKEDGSIEVIEPELLEVGNIIRIEPGEKVPVDGVVISGSSFIDTKALTGESLPKEVTMGEEVLSGTINLDSAIDMKVTRAYEDSAVAKILELVENSTNVKSKQENFISKFAKWYTPIVVISALLLALIGFLVSGEPYVWIGRALNFLVVSCPCAIVISVPLSFFTSIGKAAKLGILIKGSLYLENFNKIDTFVFDKTGTLTKGNFAITKVIPEENREEILRIASLCESQSSHPIALSIKKEIEVNPNSSLVIHNKAGKGIVAEYENEKYYCGNKGLFVEELIEFNEINEIGTVVYVGKNQEYIGAIIIQDEVKDNAKELIDYLHQQRINSVMLTGDNERVASSVSSALNVDRYHHSLLPQDKVALFQEIMEKKNKNSLIAYLGDGINDAPVLALADVGISMGAIGSDAAIEASDIVLMNDNLHNVVSAKKIAKKTMRIVIENIVFALTVKIAILILSAFGLASIWLAVFGDVGVALLCVLNALRSGRISHSN